MAITITANKWTIQKRIATGSATLLAILLVVSCVSAVAFSRLKSFAKARLLDDAIPGLVYCSEMVEYAMQAQVLSLMVGPAADAAKREQLVSEIDKAAAKITESIKQYEGTISAAEDRRNFEQLLAKRAEYLKIRAVFVNLAKTGKIAEADALMAEKLYPAYVLYRDHLVMMLKWNENAAWDASKEMIATSQKAMVASIATAGCGVVVAMVVGWVLVRGINKVLSGVAHALGEGSHQVVSAAAQISASSQTLAESASEQAASLEETGSSLEEMASMTKRNVENSQSANTLAKETRSAAENGTHEMQAMIAAMEGLKVSSNDIAKIIKTINEIAFQTNILALNAAVEAARAGEAGMGFAVVADEVRSLAQRCARAAQETAEQIENAILRAGQGAEISTKVAEALGAIVTRIRQLDDLAGEVCSASTEQRQGIEQINGAVCQLDQVTQSNAAGAEECASAAEELNAQAEAMKGSVGELLELVGGKLRSAEGRDHAQRSARAWKPAIKVASRVDNQGQVNGKLNGKVHFIETSDAGVTIH